MAFSFGYYLAYSICSVLLFGLFVALPLKLLMKWRRPKDGSGYRRTGIYVIDEHGHARKE
jgi:hypothetical protein